MFVHDLQIGFTLRYKRSMEVDAINCRSKLADALADGLLAYIFDYRVTALRQATAKPDFTGASSHAFEGGPLMLL